MEDFLKNLSDSAKSLLEKTGVKLEEVGRLTQDKLNELAAKADELADMERENAHRAVEELKQAKEKIAKHGGGALGFLADKANELIGEVREEAAEAAESAKGFWEKAKDFVADKREPSDEDENE